MGATNSLCFRSSAQLCPHPVLQGTEWGTAHGTEKAAENPPTPNRDQGTHARAIFSCGDCSDQHFYKEMGLCSCLLGTRSSLLPGRQGSVASGSELKAVLCYGYFRTF